MTMVLAVCGVAASLVASVALRAQPRAPGPDRDARRLVVATYNIQHGSGTGACTTPPAESGEPAGPDCDLDLARTAAVIRSLDADIVGLQEVDRFWGRSGGVDQARELARMLGMRECYGANLDHPPDGHARVPHQYGTAILSRWPILRCRNRHLPRTSEANEQRGLLEAVIDVVGSRLRVYNTHLQHDSVDDRILQVQAIAEALAAVDEPVIVLGDLNAEPGEPSLAPLLARLTDAWAAAGGGEGPTHPAASDRPPVRRIDYVLVSPGITLESAEVPAGPETARASDHYPVVSRVVLER